MFVRFSTNSHTDPSFDASTLLHPLAYYRHQPHSLAQYDNNANADDPSRSNAHALRHQSHRSQNPHRHQNQGKKGSAAATSKFKSPLAILQADQAALKQRKASIARFGSSWLRPAGVPKTYQAMMDEAAEREEQEAQARREAAATEEQNAARQAEVQAAAAAVAGGTAETPARRRTNPDRTPPQFGAEGAMDVDLDGDVPEAEEVEYDDEEDDEDDAATQERDLDDSIPEAGSYQHTDTDVEDEESISLSISEHLSRNPHVDAGVPPENQLHPPRILDGATGTFVHSIEGTSEFMPVENPEFSSFLGSPSATTRERSLERADELMARQTRGSM